MSLVLEGAAHEKTHAKCTNANTQPCQFFTQSTFCEISVSESTVCCWEFGFGPNLLHTLFVSANLQQYEILKHRRDLLKTG